MTYDAWTESVALLTGAPVSQSARLSRRVRSLPLAVDRDGDVAVTLFLRRGVSGIALLEAHTLERDGAGWRLLGGGGGPADDPAVRPRLADVGGPARSEGGGGTTRSRPARGNGWVSWAELRLAEEVTTLEVRDRRLDVARHGFAVVVWSGRPPPVVARDASDAPLGTVDLGTEPSSAADRMPECYSEPP